MNQSSQNHLHGPRIAFIAARWHADIVDQARDAFTEEIAKLTDDAAKVSVFEVPGAFEIPLQAKLLGNSARYAAIVGAAFVVDGGIYRHEFVAETVVSGLMQAQLDTEVPVVSVVLTPHHYHECEEHRQFFLDHFRIKGREAAEACVSLLDMRKDIHKAA